jgi:hypothetical protein
MSESEKISLIVSFLNAMAKKSIIPCHVFVGDDPQILSPDEVEEFAAEFIENNRG